MLLGNWLFEPRGANSRIPRRPFLERHQYHDRGNRIWLDILLTFF
jgi:hypothetical protein